MYVCAHINKKTNNMFCAADVNQRYKNRKENKLSAVFNSKLKLLFTSVLWRIPMFVWYGLVAVVVVFKIFC